MDKSSVTVPEDPAHPGRDVLGARLDKRGHYIHEVLANADEPMTVDDIAEQARQLAEAEGYAYRTREKKAFSVPVTRNHLRCLREKDYAEQLPGQRWQLTDPARQRIKATRDNDTQRQALVARTSMPVPEVRTADDKGRVLLSKQFANATVTIEAVSPTEMRIRKAVVIPEAELPLLEDQLRPLSDRDRDFFLNLLDNPPEPTPALRVAAAKYKKRHG